MMQGSITPITTGRGVHKNAHKQKKDTHNCTASHDYYTGWHTYHYIHRVLYSGIHRLLYSDIYTPVMHYYLLMMYVTAVNLK